MIALQANNMPAACRMLSLETRALGLEYHVPYSQRQSCAYTKTVI